MPTASTSHFPIRSRRSRPPPARSPRSNLRPGRSRASRWRRNIRRPRRHTSSRISRRPPISRLRARRPVCSRPPTVRSPNSAPRPAMGAQSQKNWDWNGGTPITVGQGETIQTVSRRYGVPAIVIAEANGMTTGTPIYPGQRLVIPKYGNSGRSAAAPIGSAATCGGTSHHRRRTPDAAAALGTGSGPYRRAGRDHVQHRPPLQCQPDDIGAGQPASAASQAAHGRATHHSG